MSAEVIESYLVSLGFETDDPSLNKFQGALHSVESFVSSKVEGIVGDFLKFQLGVTSAFIAAGFGVIGFTDKLAMGDQQMRLFAMRSFMTIDQARSVQMALGVMGASLEDVSWDRHLHDRFQVLIADQKEMRAQLGPEYEKQLQDVQEIVFQVQRLELKGQYFGMEFITDLLKKLGIGDGSILGGLERLNAFVLKSMPMWADELSTDVLPVLKDFWMILKDLGGIAEDVAVDFTNLIGLISGDTALEGSTFSFHKFASALEKVAHFLAEIVHYMAMLERLALAVSPLGLISDLSAGGASQVAGHIDQIIHGQTPSVDGPQRDVTGSVAGQARELAKKVSGMTGIPADLIFGQWAHETGGFTNRGTRELNNLAGIRYAGSTEYRRFDSLDDFAKFYAKVIEAPRYTREGINQVRTPEQLARALKAGGYYEGEETAYARGVRSFEGAYDDGGKRVDSKVSIGTINIPIQQPGATRDEIHRAVTKGVKAGIDAHTQDNMTQLNGAYA